MGSRWTWVKVLVLTLSGRVTLGDRRAPSPLLSRWEAKLETLVGAGQWEGMVVLVVLAFWQSLHLPQWGVGSLPMIGGGCSQHGLGFRAAQHEGCTRSGQHTN